MDEIYPKKIPNGLYAELKNLKKIKFENINGGLLFYANSFSVKRQIESEKINQRRAFKQDLKQNFNRAQKFAHNRLAV